MDSMDSLTSLLPHTQARFTVTSPDWIAVLFILELLVFDWMGMVPMPKSHPMWFIRLAAGPANLGLPRLKLT